MSIEAVLLLGTPPDRAIEQHLAALATAGTVVRASRRHGRAVIARRVDGLWRAEGIRAGEVLVIDGCGRCPLPPGVTDVAMSEAGQALAALVQRRARGEVPDMPTDPAWTVEVLGADPTRERMHDSWFVMADGVIGTLGSPLVDYAPARRGVLVAGVYTGSGPDSDLLRAPDWTRLAGEVSPGSGVRRVLDLRTGLLHHEATTTLGSLRAVSFASRALPGVGVLRAVGDGARTSRGIAPRPAGSATATDAPDPPVPPVPRDQADASDVELRRVHGEPGGIAVAVVESSRGREGDRSLERLAAHVTRSDRTPPQEAAVARLRRARERGIDRLMNRQRSAWARRWDEMGISIEGDADLQRAVNFALYHLDASIARQREAPLGPRGLSGPSYKGHVFWDSEVFMLPFFAATRPAAARAMLAYRVRRIGAAQAAAREAGLRGAWFPWESAADGRDVTPPWVPGPDIQPLRVWTGERELHVGADIAWAAQTYAAWSGDEAFAVGDGRQLLVETARFWASRLERDPDGTVHLRGIIGPDEYHELVDDNAYTNVMVRWNLRAAAEAARRATPTGRERTQDGADTPGDGEVADWLDVAERIVDGFDPGTRIYEQFAGFHALEPVRIADLAVRPAWADVLLGRERVTRSQVVKQADVLLLHHLVPGDVVPGSLEPNLDYYEPRTAHGSSLSPATHAALLARAGRFDQALEALRMAAFMDLDDRNGTASEGLHLATMGGLWQALVMGFAGIRPSGEALAIDPRLPPGWDLLEVPVRFRGRRVRVVLGPGSLTIRSSAPLDADIPGVGRVRVDHGRVELRERSGRWVAAA